VVDKKPIVSKSEPLKSSSSVATQQVNASGQVKTAAEYIDSFSPRFAGLAYTAPVYDDVTKPVVAPYPAACVMSRTRCQCYTQQGTRLDVPGQMCKQITEGGFFVAWNQPIAQAVPVRDEKPVEPMPALAGSFGGAKVVQQSVPRYEGTVDQDQSRPRVRPAAS
jgi:hypothetical protein